MIRTRRTRKKKEEDEEDEDEGKEEEVCHRDRQKGEHGEDRRKLGTLVTGNVHW